MVVQCREAQLVVTVSKDLFGTGKLIQASDLSLGPAGCEPLASAGMDAVVKFEVGLHECGNSVQVRLEGWECPWFGWTGGTLGKWQQSVARLRLWIHVGQVKSRHVFLLSSWKLKTPICWRNVKTRSQCGGEGGLGRL